MNSEKIIISGVGCALVDLIYNGVSFDSPAFRKYISLLPGDGGLSPGKLVFTEELENFAKKSQTDILKELVGEKAPEAVNVGGPSLVSLILASQLLDREKFEVRFFGMAGKDKNQGEIFKLLQQTPLDIQGYKISEDRATPTTDVFSDPDYDHGHGERTFVNNIGAAWDFTPELLSDRFFEADIHCYGGTALVPQIHDHLSPLLKKSKSKEAITVVNTVFDFRNQKKAPDKPWPLVDDIKDFELIDLLIMDHEEALRISGKNEIDVTVAFFSNSGVASFIITNGAKDIVAYSNGRLFREKGDLSFATSRNVREALIDPAVRKGDTTGCGDNFAGAVIASLASQLKEGKRGQLDLSEAISWGVAAGGNCCFTVGGTCMEEMPGEMMQKIETIQRDYLKQIGEQ
jgi:sugar/nucleoside kinase (ribokinase family)